MKDHADPWTDGATGAPADPLDRIASALEALAGQRAQATGDWLSAPAYVWDGRSAAGVRAIEAPQLALLRGIDKQRHAVTVNVQRHAHGHAAHDMLLWGSRGMGKSALIRAAVKHVQDTGTADIALVQAAGDTLDSLPALFSQLAGVERKFVLYCDDLGFADGDSGRARHLRSWLDGGVQARPANVRLAVTSNRRAIVSRHASEQDDPINPRDAVDDQLALADRFGLSLGFHACSQDDYLQIVNGYAQHYGLSYEPGDALEWAKRRGARSGRVAWHYVNELAGRAGRALS